MAQFLLLFEGFAAPEQADDAETQAYTAKWMDWMAGLARDGVLVSAAPLLDTGKRVDRDGAHDLALERVDVGGYALVEAASLEATAEIARTAPHTALGGSTIVRPVIPRR
jgi:hypothetical protein